MPELNRLSFENLIHFAVLDLTAWGDEVRRFADTSTYEGASPETSHITWQGHEYLAVPFQVGGLQRGGENLVRPGIQIGDHSGELYELMRSYGFAPGAHVTVYQVFKDDVIADDPFAPFATYEYVLNSVKKQGIVVEFELATHIDFAMRKFPAQIQTREEFPGLNSALLR